MPVHETPPSAPPEATHWQVAAAHTVPAPQTGLQQLLVPPVHVWLDVSQVPPMVLQSLSMLH